MSLFDKFCHTFLPALPLAMPAAQQTARELSQVLTEFREQRAEDFAQLADRAGRSGVRLVQAERERDSWQAYAKDLERLCLAQGIEMPRAPDEEHSE